jgi:hypothetical protein
MFWGPFSHNRFPTHPIIFSFERSGNNCSVSKVGSAINASSIESEDAYGSTGEAFAGLVDGSCEIQQTADYKYNGRCNRPGNCMASMQATPPPDHADGM